MRTKTLSPTELQLLSLVTTERTGREVAKSYRRATGRRISYGTLYTTFRRLRERGLVRMRGDQYEDGRIRFFRITAAGAHALDRAREHYASLAAFGV